MATPKDYIPKSDVDFFNWQANLVTLTNTNLVAWAVPALSFTPVTTEQGIYTPLYNKITNKNNRTTADVTAHRIERKKYEGILRQFVKEFLINNSKVTDAQRQQLEITVRDKVPSSRSAIDTAPFAQFKALAGARIQVECRVENDSNRTSKHPDADVVEVVYSITIVPTGTKDCPNTVVSSKAKFLIPFDNANAGKKFYGYVRWKNTSDDSKSGPWSALMNKTITD